MITTNYDDALEQAFAAAGEERRRRLRTRPRPNEPGRFVHVRPDGERVAIPEHTDYRDFALEERSVILKIHGAVDRGDETADSYVITEDHYIDYLAQENVARAHPRLPDGAGCGRATSSSSATGCATGTCASSSATSGPEQTRHFAAWAIQLAPGEIDRRFWERHGVEILDAALEEWVDAMRAELG